MKIILFGSTGMVGRGVLLECLETQDVESILLINRNPIDLKYPKVSEILLQDFFRIASIRDSLGGYDACFFSLGITSVGADEAAYKKIMYDAPILIARTLFDVNPGMVFCFISGKGTDPSSKTLWARVKGDAEVAILSMGFKDAYMFRPGHIQPMRGVRSRTKWYNMYYAVLGKIYFLLKRIPSYVTDTDTLARAMIRVVKYGYSKKILESVDINIVGK